jgi:malonate decarboxylase beta subunit
MSAFRQATLRAIEGGRNDQAGLTLSGLEAEQDMLERRLQDFGGLSDPLDVWKTLGIPDPAVVPVLDEEAFVNLADRHRRGGK